MGGAINLHIREAGKELVQGAPHEQPLEDAGTVPLKPASGCWEHSVHCTEAPAYGAHLAAALGIHATGGQSEGRQPGSLRAGGSSDAVRGRGPAGRRLPAEDPHPPMSRTSGDGRQHMSAVATNIFVRTQFKQFKQRWLGAVHRWLLAAGECVTTRHEDAMGTLLWGLRGEGGVSGLLILADGGAEPCPLEVQLPGTVLEVGGPLFHSDVGSFP